MCAFSNFHIQQCLLITPETWIIRIFFLLFMHLFLFISSDNWGNVTQPSVRRAPQIALTHDKHIQLAISWLVLCYILSHSLKQWVIQNFQAENEINSVHIL